MHCLEQQQEKKNMIGLLDRVSAIHFESLLHVEFTILPFWGSELVEREEIHSRVAAGFVGTSGELMC